MERRDYLMYQIEQMGKVIAQVLSDFLGLKSQGKTTHGIEQANITLKNELDVDIERVITLGQEELAEYLDRRKLTAAHIEKLIDYLTEAGEGLMDSNAHQSLQMLESASVMYACLDAHANTFSFERITKEEKLKSLLNRLNKNSTR